MNAPILFGCCSTTRRRAAAGQSGDRSPHSKELSPRVWDGIIGTNEEMIKVRIDTRHGVERELARMPKGVSSEVIGHALTAPSAVSFIGFARFPVTRIEGTEFGYRVTFIDFRFYNEVTGRSFAAEVLLDQSLRVVKDSLAFNALVKE